LSWFGFNRKAALMVISEVFLKAQDYTTLA